MEKTEKALEKAAEVIHQMERFMGEQGLGVGNDEKLAAAYLDYLETAREIDEEETTLKEDLIKLRVLTELITDGTSVGKQEQPDDNSNKRD